jgi:hypothetical protein
VIEGDAGGDVIAAEDRGDGEQYRYAQPAGNRFAVQRYRTPRGEANDVMRPSPES